MKNDAAQLRKEENYYQSLAAFFCMLLMVVFIGAGFEFLALNMTLPRNEHTQVFQLDYSVFGWIVFVLYYLMGISFSIVCFYQQLRS